MMHVGVVACQRLAPNLTRRIEPRRPVRPLMRNRVQFINLNFVKTTFGMIFAICARVQFYNFHTDPTCRLNLFLICRNE